MKYSLRHVLLVDDDTEAADALARVLHQWFHCQVHIAYDGADAIELATVHRPDAVVLKANLPGVTSREVASVLRRLFRRAPPKLIAFGPDAHDPHRLGQRNGAFDAWLSEPLNLRALMVELSDDRPRAQPASQAALRA
jgi:DNA-binding response OmpR family regulator